MIDITQIEINPIPEPITSLQAENGNLKTLLNFAFLCAGVIIILELLSTPTTEIDE